MEIVSISKYSLDEKRDAFARLLATGKDPAKAYNITFHDMLNDIDAYAKAKEIAETPCVTEKILQYIDDRRVLNTITRQDVAVQLKRVVDCDASDFYEMDEQGQMKIKPMDKWTRSMKAAFSGIRYTRNGIELKVYDKISAVNSLVNLMGWDKVPEENRMVNELSGYTDEQLKTLANNVEDAKLIEDVDKQG